MSESYFHTRLKNFELPLTRAAYSDRTAWLMCEMSALAYLPFEVKGTIEDAVLEKKYQPPEKTSLSEYLQKAGFELVETFNLNETQAFLAKRESDKTAVLAFRGTEANKWKDVKTDIKAWTKNSDDGTKIHSGFADAFNHVKFAVDSAISNSCQGYSLYITGHSLGGALAIIAAKELEKTTTKIAACYTFGSPRVGNEEFNEKIKAPVYRVVNAADGVPLVPPSKWMAGVFIFVLRSDYLKNNFSGYTHYGDMRYLTACNSSMSNLKLLENPGFLDRFFKRWRRAMRKGWLIFGKDHGIAQYRKKLRHYAEQRNLS